MLQDAQSARAKPVSQLLELSGHPAIAMALTPASVHQPSKQDVDRALLFLDIAARQARHLVMEIDNPSCRENFEMQIAAIEQLLQIAKDKALQL